MEEKARKFLTDFWCSTPSEAQVCAFLDMLRKVEQLGISRDQKRNMLIAALRESLTQEQLCAHIKTLNDSFAEILTFPSLVPGQPDNPMVEKEIGPEGGVIELENVARLEIPPGALDKPTFIQIHQVLQVESTKEQFPEDLFSAAGPGYDFITPVVRLEPFGLKLNIAAKLYLPTDAVRVGVNDPEIIEYTASATAKNGEWSFDPFLEAIGTPGAPVPTGIQDPIMVKYFAYAAKQFPANVRPEQGAKISYSY